MTWELMPGRIPAMNFHCEGPKTFDIKNQKVVYTKLNTVQKSLTKGPVIIMIDNMNRF